MRKKRDEEALRLQEVVPDPAAEGPEVMDAAESRWDPWLLALARMEAASELRMN